MLLLLSPAAARAATVAVEGGVLRVTAGPGEVNAVAVAPGGAPGTLAVTDLGPAPSAGAGCTPTGAPSSLACVEATSVEADLGDLDDSLTLSAPAAISVRGGVGDDTLTAAPAGWLFAPPTARLDGGDGDDTLIGGPGGDELDGGLGADAADGGAGSDAILLRDRKVDTALCRAGRDSVRAEVLDELDIACERVDYGPAGRAGRLRPVSGGGRFVPIPGQTWARVDRRILADVLYMVRRYHVRVGDGYATVGHKPHGEHPLGLAVDLYPGPGGSWGEVARLAKWAEPRQNSPRWPFRWVGWNGDENHGDPAHCRISRGCPPHLHLSWAHSPGSPGHPVRTVWVFDVR
jgi:hypothetical protein